MNKYAALGLLLEAAEGKTVAVISRTRAEVRHALGAFEVPLGDGWKTRRTNGAERIDAPSGGRILFLSARQSLRGMSLDVVYVESDADALMGEHEWSEVRLACSHRPDASIVRA